MHLKDYTMYESWNKGKRKTNEQLPHFKKIPSSTFFFFCNTIYIKAILIDFQLHWRGGGVSNIKQHFSFMSKSCSVSTIEGKSWFSEVAAGVIDRDPAKVTPQGNAGSWILTLPAGTQTIYRGFFFFVNPSGWESEFNKKFKRTFKVELKPCLCNSKYYILLCFMNIPDIYIL